MKQFDSIDRPDFSGQHDACESAAAFSESHCDQQKAFEHAAQAIVGKGCPCPSDPASFGGEIRNLEEWARCQKTLIAESSIDNLDVVSNSTSEHEVFYRGEDSRAVKRTWAGVYGQVPVVMSGGLGRRNAAPSEYLKRMALQIAVFGSDLRFEGVTVSSKPSMIIGEPSGQPAIVISQRWYEKQGLASNEAIHEFLVREGFRSVPSSYFGWFRPADGVVIVDAKPDNFIQTAAGLVPIDLQMAIFDQSQLAEAGLRSDPESPVIFIPRDL